MLHEMLNFIVWSVRLLAPLKNTTVKISSDKEAADFFFFFFLLSIVKLFGYRASSQDKYSSAELFLNQ